MKFEEVVQEPLFAQERAPSTVATYRSCLRVLSGHGIDRLEDVTVPAVATFVSDLLRNVTAATADNYCTALLAVLAYLQRTGRAERALVDSIRDLRPAIRRPELLSAAWLTRAQVEQLAAVRVRSDAFAVLTLWVAVLSGLRAAELGRLLWCDVDLGARLIAVRGPTKTRKERTVPICLELMQVLQNHPMAQRTRALGGAVLSDGTHVGRASIGTRIRNLSRRSGIYASPVLCRHTRASWWIQGGVPIAKVAAWMGHSPDVCARYYAGLLRCFDPDADRMPA